MREVNEVKESLVDKLTDDLNYVKEEIESVKNDEKINKVHKYQDLERLIGMELKLVEGINKLL